MVFIRAHQLVHAILDGFIFYIIALTVIGLNLERVQLTQNLSSQDRIQADGYSQGIESPLLCHRLVFCYILVWCEVHPYPVLYITQVDIPQPVVDGFLANQLAPEEVDDNDDEEMTSRRKNDGEIGIVWKVNH